MKNIIIALFCLISIRGSAQDKFQIIGKLPSAGTGRKVLLQYKDSKGEDARDSVTIQNGLFILKGTTAFATKATLTLLPVKIEPGKRKVHPDQQLFFLEKGNYSLNGTDSIAKSTITGTPSQQEYLFYQQQTAGPMAAYQVLFKKQSAAIAAKDSAQMLNLRGQMIALNNRMSAIRDSFIFNHPNSYVTLDLVVHEVSPIIHPEYYQALSKRVLESYVGQRLTDRVEKSKLIALGKSIDITQPDEKGNLFTLSSLRGKYVLVDFWASWCGPCRGETPYLIRAYQTLKSKNFEIVSVSLDQSKAAWLKAINEDKMPWIQLSDLKGEKNDAAVKFGINSIPQNVLLNPNGVIIAKNLRGEDVTERIADLIK